jgi:hypothetical protein
MLRSSQQRAERQAKLKAKMHAQQHAPDLVNGTPSVEVLPPMSQQRDVGGRFAKGHTLRTGGRPRDEFAQLARSYVDRYQLLYIAAQMGAGIGKFAKTDHSTRLRAIEFCISRAYGPQPVTIELEADRAILIKRIIGINDADV